MHIQAMLATRSITQCLKHIMCPMEQVPEFQSRTFKKACMLGECPHCGWEKKLDYVVKSDFSITWQGFECLRVGNQRQNTPYGQEAAFVEGEKKTRQERVKMDGLFRGDFKAAPSNKWWQTKPLLGEAIGSMLVKDLKVALKARGLPVSGLKVNMARRLSQFELHRNNQLDPSGTIAAAALVGREEQAVGTDTTAQSQGSAAAVKSSFLTIFRNHIVKKLGKHIFMKH